MTEPISLNPANIRGTAETVSGHLIEAAQPGPTVTPGMPGQSPPSRTYTALTIGGLFPQESSSGMRSAAAEMRQGGQRRDELASLVRGSADSLGADNSGQAVDGAVEMFWRHSHLVTRHASTFFRHAEVWSGVADSVDALTQTLDSIDQNANTTVAQIRASAEGGSAAEKLAAHQATVSVLMQARGTAEGEWTAANAAIGALSAGSLDGTASVRGGSEPAGQPPAVSSGSVSAPAVPTGSVPAVSSAGALNAVSHVDGLSAMSPAAVSPFNPSGTVVGTHQISPPATLARFNQGFGAAVGRAVVPPAGTTSSPIPAPPGHQPPATTPAAGTSPVLPREPVSAVGPRAVVPPTVAPSSATPGPPSTTLPPFGSDIPRAAPTAQAAAASSPSTTAVAPAAATSAGVAAPVAAAVSLLPERHLMDAVSLVNELQHASRGYGCIDWCVGVLRTPQGPVTVVTSNEGANYIPEGVYLPRDVGRLFIDSRWFGWSNPAETMCAYADAAGIELAALVVSTNDGGSAKPAQLAGVRQYDEVDLSMVPEDTPVVELDETRRHRLAVVDPCEYERVVSITDPHSGGLLIPTVCAVDLMEALEAGIEAQVVSTKAQMVFGAVSDLLIAHLDIPELLCDWLDDIAQSARMDASLYRPGRIVGESPTYRNYFDVARIAELLGYWRSDPPQWAEIAYTIEQIKE